jgi:carbon-monoxide dehydrogenase iron sulfur subunit
MGKMIVTDIEKCIGCGLCELICSFKHHGEFNPTKSRIHKTVFVERAVSIPVVCYQCEHPWCGQICPAGAITIEKDAKSGATIVEVSETKCVGCRMCMLACPYGNIVVSEKGCAEKCDLCDGDPECVKFCASGAIRFADPELGLIARKKAVAEKLLDSYKEAKY